MSTDPLYSSAWLLRGHFASIPGTLELEEGLLTFSAETGCVFEVPVTSLSNVAFPWHNFGAGVTFSIGAEHYRFSFIEPGDSGDIVSGREAGKLWKQRLLK